MLFVDFMIHDIKFMVSLINMGTHRFLLLDLEYHCQPVIIVILLEYEKENAYVNRIPWT